MSQNQNELILRSQMMREPSGDFASLLEILNFRSKRDLNSHCKSVTVRRRDLVALIVAAQSGALEPYKYANHFSDTVPIHLVPREKERSAIAANGVGQYKTKKARSFARKIFQFFQERRILAAHLFYTPDHRYWHIFYFDNRDKSRFRNHWKLGAHIHYFCDLWTDLTMETAWQKITSGKINLASKIHIRYDSEKNEPNI